MRVCVQGLGRDQLSSASEEEREGVGGKKRRISPSPSSLPPSKRPHYSEAVGGKVDAVDIRRKRSPSPSSLPPSKRPHYSEVSRRMMVNISHNTGYMTFTEPTQCLHIFIEHLLVSVKCVIP